MKKVPSSRISTTTIDVPLFLQSNTFESPSAPPLPVSPPSSVRIGSGYIPSSESQRIPPLPPRKIPLDEEEEAKVPQMKSRRPQYDPQHSYDGGHSPISQRPRFDPQNSHENTNSPSSWQHTDQQPSIPAPEFTSFHVELAPPSVSAEQDNESQTIRSIQKSEVGSYRASQSTEQPSISSVGRKQDLWTSNSNPWNSHVAYFPAPERYPDALPHHDGLSSSNTDISSNTAGKSSPESQQTSNTSHKDSDNQANPSDGNQTGDDSFYWHSGRSSSDVEEEISQCSSPVATPGETSLDQRSSTTNSTVVQREHQDLPARSTSLSPAASSAYGASALGFGGPSDWEYFGDYEAEEVDDEELYSRPKARESSNIYGGSAELPADCSPPRDMELSQRSKQVDLESILQEIPPFSTKSPTRQQDASHVSGSETHILTHHKKSEHAINSMAVTVQNSVTPRPLSTHDPTSSSGLSSDQRPDLDEVIRAWSEAPYVGKLESESPSLSCKQDKNERSPNLSQASLVSTLQEGVVSENLGVGLEEALSLPSTLNPTKSSDLHADQVRRSGDGVVVPQDTSLMTLDTEQPAPDLHLTKQSVMVGHKETTIAKNESMPPEHLNDNAKGKIIGHSARNFFTLSPSAHTKTTKKVEANNTLVESTKDTNFGQNSSQIDERAPDKEPPVTQPALPQASHSQETSPENTQAVKQGNSEEIVQQNVRQSSIQGQVDQSFSPGLIHAALSDGPVEEEHLSTLPPDLQISLKATQAEPLDERNAQSLPKVSTDRSRSVSLGKQERMGELKPNMAGATRASIASQLEVPAEKVSTNEAAEGGAIKNSSHSEISKTSSAAQQNPLIGSPKNEKDGDPYADLDPWGKASLNRFAAMLREESRAESNKDKLNIFHVFTSRESRLRVVLYGTEDELVKPSNNQVRDQASANVHEGKEAHQVARDPEKTNLPKHDGFVKQAVQRANTMSLQRSLKALPALPANRESVIGMPTKALAPLIIQEKPEPTISQESSDSQSPVDGVQYSPGGRLIVARLSRDEGKDMKNALQRSRASSEATAGATDADTSNFKAPIMEKLSGVADAAKNPAYKPPKYQERRSEVKNYLANRKSVIRPYATLTQGSLESGSTFGRRPDDNEVASAKSTIAVPTSQYSQSSQLKGEDSSATKSRLADQPNGPQPDLRRFVKADFDPLLAILPSSEATIYESARLNDLRNIIEDVPDDFSFIHQSVVAWDAKAKRQREENDKQRHQRQIESEQRIDSLFDDHEIGYGDIAELESEFKRSEAACKADEDRSEYQLFVSDVFTFVWTRLHYELDQLNPHYEQYSNLMKKTLAGKDMFGGSADSLALAPTMSLFLTLHQKLEIRYQKAFEAVLERDRRLKKTEISPWYTLSNIVKVKHLEKQFEDAEKRAIIEYCQQRAVRANCLMDVLDHNTLRGVGSNQDYMEAIFKAVRRIASGRAFSSLSGSSEPTAGMQEVEKAKAVTTLLATSSEQIVQTFHVADMLLNSADYEVSVARAKVLDKTDKASLGKLNEERAKEDQKLMRDLEHRLALIREDTRRTNDEIVKLMLFLGVANGRADSGRDEISDPEHTARMQRALEDAKKRNALKVSES